MLLCCCKIALNNSGTGLWAQQCLLIVHLMWIILMFSGFTLKQSVQFFFNLLMWLLVLKNVAHLLDSWKKQADFCSKSHPPLHVGGMFLFRLGGHTSFSSKPYLSLSARTAVLLRPSSPALAGCPSLQFRDSSLSFVKFPNLLMEQSWALSSLVLIRLWQSHVTLVVLKNNQCVISIVSKLPPAEKNQTTHFLCKSGECEVFWGVEGTVSFAWQK